MRIKTCVLALMLAINAMAQGVIDVHSHIITPEFLSALEGEGRLMDEGFPLLLTITTPDHLLYGSDYPYVAPQVLTQSLQRMKQYLTSEPDLAPYQEMILWKNAQQLFQTKQ